MSNAMIDQCYAEGALNMLAKTFIVLLLISLTWISLVSEPVETISAGSITRYELKALAVDEEGRGAVIPIEIIVKKPGHGELHHDERTIGKDTLISIRLSLLYASALSGVDYREYDYYVKVMSPYMVKGASATLLFTLAFTSILSNTSIPMDTSATGVIGPGGAIGLVLGIDSKLDVAEENKLNGVIARAALPIDKSIYVPAYTVIDAYAKYSGDAIIKPIYMSHGDSTQVLYAKLPGMINAYYYLFNKSNNVLNTIKDIWRDEYYDKALKYLNIARSFYEKGYYYTASSLSFTSLYNAYTSLLNYLYSVNETQYNETRDEILNETMYMIKYVESVVNAIVNKYRENGKIPIAVLDSLITTKTRVMDSKIVLNDLLDIEKPISSKPILYNSILSYLYARTLTAISWVNMTMELASYEDYSWYIDINTLHTSIQYIEEFVNITLEYCGQLFGIELITLRGFDHRDIDPVLKYLDLASSLIIFTKSFYSFNTMKTVFTSGYQTRDLVNLLPWVKGLIYSISPDPTELVSSALLLELVNNYIGLGDISTEDLVSMTYQEFTRLLLCMALKMRIQRDVDMHQITPFVSTRIVFLISAIYYITGALLVYVSIKRRDKNHDFTPS